MNAPAAEVAANLKTHGEGDILVNCSASVIRPLLQADLLDRLYRPARVDMAAQEPGNR